jgi:hypothetical protein
MSNRIVFLACIAAMGIGARADEEERLRAVPWVYVGDAGDCGPGYPAGSNIVTSAWLRGMGLPDNGQDNTTVINLLTGSPSRRDPHYGLLLNKNGPTADCSAAGATIRGVRGLRVPSVDPVFVLGFDFRNGTHCGAGSPRFNVVARSGSNPRTFHFIGGCANGVLPPATPAPQDPTEWTRVRFANSDATAFPPIPPGSTIESIELIVDEGTDATSIPDDPRGVGLSVVDNIYVNGRIITSGTGIAPGGGPGRDDD